MNLSVGEGTPLRLFQDPGAVQILARPSNLRREAMEFINLYITAV
jgi:hypothetical protein